MTTPQADIGPAPEEIDPLETSDIGKDKADHPPIPYNGPIGGMAADADTAPQPATGGMSADAPAADALPQKADEPDQD